MLIFLRWSMRSLEEFELTTTFCRSSRNNKVHLSTWLLEWLEFIKDSIDTKNIRGRTRMWRILIGTISGPETRSRWRERCCTLDISLVCISKPVELMNSLQWILDEHFCTIAWEGWQHQAKENVKGEAEETKENEDHSRRPCVLVFHFYKCILNPIFRLFVCTAKIKEGITSSHTRLPYTGINIISTIKTYPLELTNQRMEAKYDLIKVIWHPANVYQNKLLYRDPILNDRAENHNQIYGSTILFFPSI